MSLSKSGSQAVSERADIVARLTERRSEIERFANLAIESVEPPAEVDLPADYSGGVSRAVMAVFDYLLTSIAAGSTAAAEVPLSALEQARCAARAGLNLQVVLRRYYAADRSFRRVLADELCESEPGLVESIDTLTARAIDQVMRDASTEFEAEALRLIEHRDPVRDLTTGVLQGELRVSSVDGYQLDRWHVGLISNSDVPKPLIAELARRLDAQLLITTSDSGRALIWLGKNAAIEMATLEDSLKTILASIGSFGVGEPRFGLKGWRLTHLEAKTAIDLPTVAEGPVVRLRRNVLAAAVLNSKTITESLTATYIAPLETEPNSAQALRETMRAYLDTGQNANSAAQLLRIDRHTVMRRVRKVEELVGDRVEDCFAQLDVALRVTDYPSASKQAADARSSKPGA